MLWVLLGLILACSEAVWILSAVVSGFIARAALKTGEQVVVSLNLPQGLPLLQEIAERRLIKELLAMKQGGGTDQTVQDGVEQK